MIELYQKIPYLLKIIFKSITSIFKETFCHRSFSYLLCFSIRISPQFLEDIPNWGDIHRQKVFLNIFHKGRIMGRVLKCAAIKKGVYMMFSYELLPLF